MREVPREAARELESVQNFVSRFHEIGAEVAVPLEQSAEPAPAFVCERRSESSWRQPDQMLESLAPVVVGSQPGADHEHSR